MKHKESLACATSSETAVNEEARNQEWQPPYLLWVHVMHRYLFI